jgi:hypothetical protein
MSTIEAPAVSRRAEPAAASPSGVASPPAPRSARPAAAATGRAWTWRTALAALAVAYVTYTVAKLIGAGDGDLGTAHANALWVVDLERSLGVDVERQVQHALDAPALVWLFNHLYMAAQFVVVPAVVFLVRRRSIPAFRRLRDTLVVTWVLATPVNAFFAVAPPRMAGIGITDTITASGSDALTSSFSTAFYNPLAAVPSLHVAFAFAVGVAAALTFRSWPVRVLGLAWGPIVALTVVATGNHYVFDAAAGVAIVLVGLAIALAPRRSPVPALRRVLAAPVPALRRGLAAAGTLALTPAPSVVSLRSATRPLATGPSEPSDDGEAQGTVATTGADDAARAQRGPGRCCSVGR